LLRSGINKTGKNNVNVNGKREEKREGRIIKWWGKESNQCQLRSKRREAKVMTPPCAVFVFSRNNNHVRERV